MSDYLSPNLSGELHEMSVLALAHVGDAVFELMVLTWLCLRGASTPRRIHDEAVTFVSAKAQAASFERISTVLSEDELGVYKRGRNAHVNSVPRGSTVQEYHTATGIEALFGYLYLSGQTDRLNTLFELIVSDE